MWYVRASKILQYKRGKSVIFEFVMIRKTEYRYQPKTGSNQQTYFIYMPQSVREYINKLLCGIMVLGPVFADVRECECVYAGFGFIFFGLAKYFSND